jgi:SAM-dependent methyltransferase
MERITDWIKLWREVLERRETYYNEGPDRSEDMWRDRARSFHEHVKERWARPDSSRDMLLSRVDDQTTVLDIGAGTGAWTLLLAKKARHVTAVEPSQAMVDVLRENLEAEGITNVDIVMGYWPEVEVEPHDLSLCSHAMYGMGDLPTFVRSMVAATRRTCFLLTRAPLLDGVMAQAARRVWGQPHDSPNFVIAYNALIQMGIYANVQMENTGVWGAWKNDSLEAAFDEIKGKLGLQGPSEHDEFLMDLLRANLKEQDGVWVWPPSVRSALIYWDVDSE